jgi:hypothetical protein
MSPAALTSSDAGLAEDRRCVWTWADLIALDHLHRLYTGRVLEQSA